MNLRTTVVILGLVAVFPALAEPNPDRDAHFGETKAFMSPKITATVWAEACKIADENNQPGKFTAFRSYEWTSMPGQRNLHRNIFFRGDKVPESLFSALDSQDPTELWKWMDVQRKAGNELLAISHNANVSDG
jgi:hypothetical protein